MEPIAPVIIVPGLSNSGDDHWQTHWQRQIAGSTRVVQDDWETPRLDRWLERLAATVAERPGAILVGHSLGALLIAHLAEHHPRLPVAGALLVAPADADAATRAGRTLRDITAGSFNPMPLSPLPFPTVLAASRNDPYLGFSRARALARLWEARFADLGVAGHVNVASGHGSWPDGLKLLEQVHTLALLHDRPRTRPAERSGVVVPLAPTRLATAAVSRVPACRRLAGY
jgi:predicted alpha/beta hydrolase family esterase